ncbi:hypothetical protein BGZ93_011382 [Podila epicladia]|nr:hypothetical protein BGZ92_008987 [Podila epicladia]KAG0098479.1 hypothetical protein BGZ93_011382 [Podila epicladia]
MGNKSSKLKHRHQQIEQEPELNPPYARASRAKAHVEVAHSMDEIRESSGVCVQSQRQLRQEQEMDSIRASAMMPRASQVYHAHNSPQPYYAPAPSNHERDMALIRESSGAYLC